MKASKLSFLQRISLLGARGGAGLTRYIFIKWSALGDYFPVLSRYQGKRFLEKAIASELNFDFQPNVVNKLEINLGTQGLSFTGFNIKGTTYNFNQVIYPPKAKDLAIYYVSKKLSLPMSDRFKSEIAKAASEDANVLSALQQNNFVVNEILKETDTRYASVQNFRQMGASGYLNEVEYEEFDANVTEITTITGLKIGGSSYAFKNPVIVESYLGRQHVRLPR